jgi:hypothetical protein
MNFVHDDSAKRAAVEQAYAIWNSRAELNRVPVIPLLRTFHQPLP